MALADMSRKVGITRGFLNNIDADIQEAQALELRAVGQKEKDAIIAQLRKRIEVNIDEARKALDRINLD